MRSSESLPTPVVATFGVFGIIGVAIAGGSYWRLRSSAARRAPTLERLIEMESRMSQEQLWMNSHANRGANYGEWLRRVLLFLRSRRYANMVIYRSSKSFRLSLGKIYGQNYLQRHALWAGVDDAEVALEHYNECRRIFTLAGG